MSFDILSAQLDDSCILHLEHPVNGPIYADEAETKPVTIELYGRSSKVHRQWLATALRKQEANKNKREKSKTPEELLEDNADFFAVMTKAVNNMTMGGKPIATKEDFKALYANPKLMWVTEAVAAELGNTESFLQR